MKSIYDSKEEELIKEWFDTLYDLGYLKEEVEKNVDDIIEITPDIKLCVDKCIHLFRPWTYKYDFKIIWSEKAKGIFYNNTTDSIAIKEIPYFRAVDDISYIDVKGSYTRKDRVTDITFPLVQKVLYFYRNKLIQKVVPIDLFMELFATDRYLKEDNIYKIGHKKGEIKQKLRSYNEFLYDGKRKAKKRIIRVNRNKNN